MLVDRTLIGPLEAIDEYATVDKVECPAVRVACYYFKLMFLIYMFHIYDISKRGLDFHPVMSTEHLPRVKQIIP